ncbi:DUF3732 domain-containing protein [Oscillibacter ruminantium]|uniref:DUF3732 domain-containing protein n=1 Tax=Oscillibacter ruminantium TaxID=1263547 RepID=UPI0002E7E0E3|nr:DUF3732 domain-containing protein [Oscillibacter ruminantium]
MNFYIDKLLLWLKDGSLRTLKFSNDKVNVITGNSKTGKTAVLEIVDYCLCGSKDTVVISYEHIGENVAWYGIRFVINNKTYTVARGEITEKGKFSDDYYFSQTGEIPDEPCTKMDESGIKAILEPEFSINDEITLAYGGKSIRKNTRLSFRYFLIFNTLSKDIIDNGKSFFDKMHIDRYRDVWPQIFDLSLGVISCETIKLQKKINDLEQEISTLELEKKKYSRKIELHNNDIQMLVKKAKEKGLVDEKLGADEAFKALEVMVKNGITNYSTNFSVQQEYEKLQLEREGVALQLTKLKRFEKSYNNYRESLRDEADALRPISYIQQEFGDKTQGEYRQFINNLANELTRVKAAIKEKRPFEYDVERSIQALNKQLKMLDGNLSRTAHVEYSPISTAEKLISLGEIRAEYNRLDPNVEGTDTIDAQIKEKSSSLAALEGQYSEIEEARGLVINTLNEFIQIYIGISENALDEYGKYHAWFDYKKAMLTLKKNMSATVANISSSSDHLFMHLCLFAGLHHMMLSENTSYVPSYLIIDQPSRPYFNTSDYNYEESEKAISIKDDWSKVKDIFKLWDNFFSITTSKGWHFQVIMLEHVSKNAWSNCNHINLVETFDGINNALIPLNYKNPEPEEK